MGRNPKDELTARQEQFCKEYVVDFNASQAAIRAGYSKNAAGAEASRLLKNVKVAARCRELITKRAKRCEVNADYVIGKIQETIERCSQAEPVEEFDHELKEYVKTGEFKFEHSGVLKGCELLGKHLGLFQDKVHHTGSISLAEMVLESMKDDKDGKSNDND